MLEKLVNSKVGKGIIGLSITASLLSFNPKKIKAGYRRIYCSSDKEKIRVTGLADSHYGDWIGCTIYSESKERDFVLRYVRGSFNEYFYLPPSFKNKTVSYVTSLWNYKERDLNGYVYPSSQLGVCEGQIDFKTSYQKLKDLQRFFYKAYNYYEDIDLLGNIIGISSSAVLILPIKPLITGDPADVFDSIGIDVNTRYSSQIEVPTLINENTGKVYFGDKKIRQKTSY